jgi:hypothetical protein
MRSPNKIKIQNLDKTHTVTYQLTYYNFVQAKRGQNKNKFKNNKASIIDLLEFKTHISVAIHHYQIIIAR